MSEIFSGQLVAGFKQQLQTNHMEILNNRTLLSIPDYEKLFLKKQIWIKTDLLALQTMKTKTLL